VDERRRGSTPREIARTCRRAVRLSTAALAPLLFALLLTLVFVAPANALPSTTTTTIVLKGEVKKQVDGLRGQAAAVQRDIDGLDLQLENLTEEYNGLNEDLETLNQELTDLRRRLRDTQELHQARQSRLGRRLTDTYKSTSAGSSNVVAALLATEDFSDFLERLFLLAKVNIQDQVLVDKVEESTEQMDAIGTAIEEKKAEGLAMRRRLEEKQAEIEGLLAERHSVLNSLDAEVAAVIEKERQRQEEERKRFEAEFRRRLTGWDLYQGPLPQIDDEVLRQVVETATTYLGVPYLWGGSRPTIGLDCSGFTQYVLRQHGVKVPHLASIQARMGVPVPRSEAEAGDLVAFGTPVHHIGMYLGGDLFIHAPRTGDVVRIQRLSSRNDVNTIRRFPFQARTGPPAID
jgi:cell wall-associated NlpC family hydrolase/uncharacterized protein YoxC